MKKNILLTLLTLLTTYNIFAAQIEEDVSILRRPHYGDTRQLFNHIFYGQPIGLGLKYQDSFIDIGDMINFISNANFISDGRENSVVWLVFKYLEKVGINNIDPGNLWLLLVHIRWYDIEEIYFSTFVAPVVQNFNNDVLTKFYHEERSRRDNNEPAQVQQEIVPARGQIAHSNIISIRCIFRDISHWNETDKYYSSPILIGGYLYYYFLQRQEIVGGYGADRKYGMAGFLRCDPQFPSATTLNHTIEYKIEVLLRNEPKPRIFLPMRIAYQEPDKAIGGKLTIGDESWEDILSGRSPMVNNDTITVTITINRSPNGPVMIIEDSNNLFSR